VSDEVGFITKAGGRFLYDKTGLAAGDPQVWEIPYFTNNGPWNNETELTGAQAKQLLEQPKTALIQGKEQTYSIIRAGTRITVSLPETGDAIDLTVDPIELFSSKGAGAFTVDIRGVANERLYLSISGLTDGGAHLKELFSVNLKNNNVKAVRHGKYPIWVDPVSEIEDGFVYGTALTPQGTALLRVDTKNDSVKLLATVPEAVWHFVATDEYVLYEVPEAEPGAGHVLGHAKIEG